MTLQAYIDDSGSDSKSPTFVLAGFIADSAAWKTFADEWKAVLAQPPAIAYFKMKEAMFLGEQFDRRKGWTRELRDSRVRDLVAVILRHAKVRVSAMIRNDEFKASMSSLPAIERNLAVDSPYIFLAQQLILTVAVGSDRYGIEQCHYCFDKQPGHMEELLARWPAFRLTVIGSSRSDLARFIGPQPTFEDEKNAVQLQAADLYAWLVRDQAIKNKVLYMPANPHLRALESLPSMARQYTSAEMWRLRQSLLAMGKQLAQQRPDVQLVPPIEAKRARKNAHQQARKRLLANANQASGRP